VTADGLVGQVTRVFSHTARVTLITDEQSAVSALDLRTQATGVVRHRAAADSLYLDRVSKKDPVHKGDEIITAGWRAAGFASLYPKGIPVGIVTSVGQTSTDLYKQVQIDPYVDVSNVHAVLVLVAKVPRP
jgi:rod shape-determining protein MreC